MKDESKTKKQLLDGVVSFRRGLDEAAEDIAACRNQAHAVIDNIVDIVVMIDKGGILRLATPSFSKVLGYENYEVIAHNLSDFLHADDCDRIITSFTRGTGAGEQGESFRFLHSSGHYLWFEGLPASIRDDTGAVTGTVISCRKMSQRIESEEAVKKSEENYRLLFEHSLDVIAMMDDDLRIISISPAVERILGYDPRELLGLQFSDLGIIAPESFESAASNIQNVLSGHAVSAAEFIFVAKDGTRKVGELSGAPLIKNGEVIGLIAVARDITERKKVEMELKSTLKQLQATQDMLIQAEKLAAVGKLAAGVAHEILNPVNNIDMWLQLLESTETLSDKIKDAFKKVRTQIDRIVKIASDMSQFSRITARNMVTADLHEMFQRIFSLTAPRLKMEEVTLQHRFEPDIPILFLDQFRIEQVFLNLIDNAIDAMKERSDKTLNVNASLQSSNGAISVLISFADNGTGIRKDISSRIFDPFFTTKEAGKGTGLGLSICYGIIQDHGGRIWAKNNVKEGTTFFIELPIERNAVNTH